VGREPRDGFPFGETRGIRKTVGNYWPYATTIFDYVNRTMPMSAPGSLTADEVYAVAAYILFLNEIIPEGAVMNAETLQAVVMPARDRFVPDNRVGGPEVR
jgi:cytochrome c